jgi:GTPase-associated protein 1, N-terminal domain type 2/GTPase-associated protein 1, C-terminal domain/GTPase-associated protein 1, middle domain
VAIQQLYYTSCERGVGGYAGFQFNAVSEGTGAKVMREVEQLTVYELPSWDSAAADAPVNLCYVPGEARGGGAITANVVYAGTDFSGRAGNYFAHALVTEDLRRDFGALLPVELWESPVWARTTVDGTSLPFIREVPPRGSFDRPVVAAFLRTQDNAQAILARLLSVVDKAIGGGRSLVLWSPTSADNARWIAAVSYLLEDARAREMSFFTYTRRPAQCRAHVIGTMPGAITSSASLADGFRVFDMTAGTLPDVETHPLAELLAQVGVLRAAGLWRQAGTLRSGTERSFDEWYPVACAAAVLLGVEPLPAGAVDAIVGWLPKAVLPPAPLAAPHVETVLTILLDDEDKLADDQLRSLLPPAKAAGATGPHQRLELIIVDRAIPLLERGMTPESAPLVTAEGTQLALSTCERLLGAATAPATLNVLDWARKCDLHPDERLVERCARDVIGPALPVLGRDGRVIGIGQAYRAFARGLAAYLVSVGPGAARSLLAGVAGELLTPLRDYPSLNEMLLIEQVKTGEIPAAQALRQVVRLRRSPASVWQDDNLLARLWPGGLQTASETEELLRVLNDGDIRRTPMLKLLDDGLAPPHRVAELLPWLRLCSTVVSHPVFEQLPPRTRTCLRAVDGLGDTLAEAEQLAKRDDIGWYTGIEERVERVPDPAARGVLHTYLGYLTLSLPRPMEQLVTCSVPVFGAACAQARIRLDGEQRQHALAARLFQLLRTLEDDDPARAQRLLDTVLVPTVPRWSRDDQGKVAALLHQQHRRNPFELLVRPSRPDLSGDFKLWCRRHARGGDPPAAGGPDQSVVARVSRWLRPRAE